MLKLLIKILFIIISFNVFSQHSDIKEYISNIPEFKNALFSFYAEDLNTGDTLIDINSDINIRPASNLKILTTIAALEVLGSNKRFKTKMLYSGNISNSKLNGNIYIISEGDPTLNSKYFNKDSVNFLYKTLNTLKSKGIKTITGNIIVLDTLFKGLQNPSTWVWGDIGNYYGAGANVIGIFDNQYKIYFNTKSEINDTAKIIKILPNGYKLNIKNEVLISDVKGDKTNIYASELCDKYIIKGFLPQNKDSFIVKGAIQNPEKALAILLKKYLDTNNVKVQGKCLVTHDKISTNNMLMEYYSPTVKEIVTATNLYSINLFAEFLFRQISIKQGGDGSNASAAKELKKFWIKKGLNHQQLNLFDGSGLSSYNLISTKNIVKTLKYVYGTSFFTDFKSTLPTAAKSGTLKFMFRKTALAGKLYAKSGTMTGVKSYSGYIYKSEDKPVVFSIVLNNYTLPSYKIKKQIQQILLYLSKNI